MAKKILIADDEELVRKSISRYIKMRCPQVKEIFEAGDGATAVDLITKNTPDIVILDVQMPIYTGIDVMRLISDAGIKPVVIILSGYTEFKYAQQAMHYGAKEYLMKPVKASELAEMLNRFLGDENQNENSTEEDNAQITQISRSAIKYIDDHYSEDIPLSLVATKLGLSPSYLSSRFSSETGMGFVDYVNKVRIEHACSYLKQGYYKVYEISEKVGFKDTKYFAKIFKKITGSTPKKFMQSGEI